MHVHPISDLLNMAHQSSPVCQCTSACTDIQPGMQPDLRQKQSNCAGFPPKSLEAASPEAASSRFPLWDDVSRRDVVNMLCGRSNHSPHICQLRRWLLHRLQSAGDQFLQPDSLLHNPSEQGLPESSGHSAARESAAAVLLHRPSQLPLIAA